MFSPPNPSGIVILLQNWASQPAESRETLQSALWSTEQISLPPCRNQLMLQAWCDITAAQKGKEAAFVLVRCSNGSAPADGDSHCFWRAGTWTDHLRSQPTWLKHVEEGIAGGYRPWGNTHTRTHTEHQADKQSKSIIISWDSRVLFY